MTKENEKNKKKLAAQSVANLLVVAQDCTISQEQIDNCINMISFFTIAKHEHVKQDEKFLRNQFDLALETEFMDDIADRKKFLSVMLQMKELRKLTKKLSPQNVVDSLGFLVAIKKAIVASNVLKHSHE